ncbi:MAG: carboxypeptidase regulatory-like domain-containing protein [Armatimonadetes bacterium]|nr:carboxypeptidase regulatory-like domain-containing protein [Armatimonadota bacterium]
MSLRDVAKPGGWLSLALLILAFVGISALGVTREVPLGQVSGTVTMKENGLNLPNADVVIEFQGEGNWEGDAIWNARTDENGQFKFPQLPAGNYYVSAYGKVHSKTGEQIKIVEGEKNEITIITDPSAPYVTMNAGERVYTPGEEITIRTEGMTTASEMSVTVSEVEDTHLLNGRSLSDFLYAVASGRSRQNPQTMAKLKPVVEEKLPLTSKDIEGAFVQEHKLAELPLGIYLLKTRVGDDTDYAWLTVTDIGMITKNDGDQVVAMVSDIKSGKAVSGVDVDLVTSQGTSNPVLTDQDGLAKFMVPKGSKNNILVRAKRAGSRAYTWFYARSESEEKYRIHVVTDRPVYRPGDEVFYKANIRERIPTGYMPASGKPVRFELEDPNGDIIANSSMIAEDPGFAYGSFKIPATGEVGSYSIKVSYDGATEWEYLTFAAYRKPDFAINVTPKSSGYVRGDIVEYEVQAETFTGEPVVGAKVTADIYQRSEWSGSPFDEDFDDWYDSDYSYDGDYLESLEGTTDDQGRAIFRLETAKLKDELFDWSDVTFTLNAAVEEPGGRYFYGSGRATVYRGQIEVAGQFRSYIANVGETVSLDIAGRANVDQKLPQSVLVEFYREVWGKRNVAEVLESRTQVKLNEGQGSTPFRPKQSGSYIAKLTTKDARGNTVTDRTYIWVSGGIDEGAGNLPSLRLLLDKPKYNAGEKAEILIQTDKPGGSALLTVEAEDIIKTMVVELAGAETTVSLDALESYAPNVDVSVCMIKDKSFQESSRSFRVGLAAKELKVKVTPDRDSVKPGESVDYLVEATDSDGNPVIADVSLGVVDEGVYQIMEDRDDPMDTFHPKRYSYVNTAWSFPEIYLDGEEKSEAGVDIRREFKDTAFWRASVRTNESGNARVKVPLPDNLTSWRATVTALTGDAKVGKATSNVIAEKELMARLSLPAFLTETDSQLVTGTVANTTDQDLQVDVRLDASGAQVKSGNAQKITVKAGTTASVSWTVEATKAGTARFQMVAKSGIYSDGLEKSIETKVRGTEYRDGAFSEVVMGNSNSFELNFPENLVQGDVTVTFAGSLTALIGDSLDYLIQYPYGCTEQTTSRFVPSVQVRELMRRNGTLTPELDAKVDDIAVQSLARLKNLQTYEGGWGWFEYDEPNAMMTGVALEGLYRARQVGVNVPDRMIEKGLEWGRKALNAESTDIWSPNWGRSTLAVALSRYGYYPEVVEYLKKYDAVKDDDQEKFSRYYESAEIALAAALTSKHNPNDAEVNRIARVTLQRMRLESLSGTDTIAFDDAKETSRVLEAMLAIDPTNPDITRIVRTLLSQRQGKSWYDTWNTSSAVSSIVAYEQSRNSVGGSGEIEFKMNGKTVRTLQIDPNKLQEVRIPYDQLPAGKTEFKVETVGSGQVYVAASTNVAFRDNNPKPISQPAGFTIKREYFRMKAQKLENGTLRYLPETKPTTQFKSGEVFRVRLTVKSPAKTRYVAIEDSIPSNCRIVEADKPENNYDWGRWWSYNSFYDDRAVFFISYFGDTEQIIEYAVRAEAPGTGVALPARAYPMYQHDVNATTGQTIVEVKK